MTRDRRRSLPARGAEIFHTMLRFAGVGLVTTLLDILVFAFAVSVGTTPGLANVMSYSCGIAVSYGLNRHWTFRTTGSHRRAVKFAASTLIGLLISTALVALLSTHVPPVFAKVITVPIVFFWNFGSAQYWVFARR